MTTGLSTPVYVLELALGHRLPNILNIYLGFNHATCWGALSACHHKIELDKTGQRCSVCLCTGVAEQRGRGKSELQTLMGQLAGHVHVGV